MQKRNYDDLEKLGESWYYASRKDLLNKLVKGTENLILDLGCGNGFIYDILKEKGKVYNVDNEQKALAYCVKKNMPNLIRSDAINLPFKDQFFDYIVALDVMEH